MAGDLVLPIWFYGAVVVSVLLVVATALRFVGPGAFLLPVLQLSREKSIATWWSGMLLAMASLHGYDAHALKRQSARRDRLHQDLGDQPP